VADENLGELVDRLEQTTDRLRALEEITSRVSRVSKELEHPNLTLERYRIWLH
jgi:hypothetical protein